MSGSLRWDVEGRIWPHLASSRFVETPRLRWHVQQMGTGPVVLLLHGTGGSTHSWGGLMPLLAEQHTVIAVDLPGHAFTSGRPAGGLTLPTVARAVSELCSSLSVHPSLLIGHSAGAAIALQLALGGWGMPIVGLNAAIKPFEGLAEFLLPAAAKLLMLNPLVPRLFAARARMPGETARFLARATGSSVGPESLACYETLFGNSQHCSGAIQMMAGWDLSELARQLPRVDNQVVLIHSTGDKAVSPESVQRVAARLPHARFAIGSDHGHLAHEEDPVGTLHQIHHLLT